MYNHRVRAPQTIVLKGDLWKMHEEYAASAALKPGHLIEVHNSSGVEKVKKHATAGGNGQIIFAKEDALQGRTIDDAYAANDPVMCHIAQRGDIIKARIPAGAAALILGDKLVSNGDGTLVKATDLATQKVIGSVEDEAVDNSAGAEESWVHCRVG